MSIIIILYIDLFKSKSEKNRQIGYEFISFCAVAGNRGDGGVKKCTGY